VNNQKLKRSVGKRTAQESQKSGLLFILSAPSGAGKTTLRRAILDQFSDLLYSISYTSRKPRKREHDGVDYHFITKEEFETGIAQNRWAEWAKVHGNYYGTSAYFLNQNLADGKNILLDLDVQGTRQILNHYPESITIFVMPPSLEVLRNRLESRGTDSAQTIALRLKNAKQEMAQQKLYRHIIINDRLADATAQFASIIEKYRTTR
jgi:guanylate kinase